MSITPYDREFFLEHEAGCQAAAEIIVPLILDLVPAHSVCDVGSGPGIWLAEFRRRGIEDVMGVDGAYIDRATLKVPQERFVARDLTKGLDIGRQFDLAMSLEVAEHLPESCARLFIESLTRLARVVLFSAAIPLQGGTEHVNEQWQSYWAELFAEKGFVAIDCVRPAVWDDERVYWWYRQNMLLYCHERTLDAYPRLAAIGRSKMLSVAHPACYGKLAWRPWTVADHAHFTEALTALPVLLRRAVRRRLGRTSQRAA